MSVKCPIFEMSYLRNVFISIKCLIDKGLKNRVVQIKVLENQSLWQKLNSFITARKDLKTCNVIHCNLIYWCNYKATQSMCIHCNLIYWCNYKAPQSMCIHCNLMYWCNYKATQSMFIEMYIFWLNRNKLFHLLFIYVHNFDSNLKWIVLKQPREQALNYKNGVL